MRDYIDINLVAAYMTDANGVPTPIDMLDWQGISLLTGVAPNLPNTFAANQWSVASGTGPREVIITVSVLPANGGSPLSGIQYRFGTGAWTTLTGVNIGPRTVLAPAAGESYEVSLRAVNASGSSEPSATKPVTSGAPAATVPAQFAANQWAVNAGSNPAEVVLDITALPGNGGSVLTALQYKVGTGAWTALTGTGTGQRTLTMSEPGASYSIAVRAVNAVGAGTESAAKTVTSAGAALSAPSVNSATIEGTTEQSGMLTANIVMAGNPAPSVESIQWKKNGGNINGATSPTWTKTGLAAGDVISYAYVVANGVLPKATGNASNPITIAALPALTAPTSSVPQGEQAIVSFNALPDSVTITQAGTALTATRIGVTNSYSFTPTTADPIKINATKAGYSPFEATWTVKAATPQIVATSANTGQLRNVTAATAPFDLQIIQPAKYAGQRPVTPSQMITGPVAHVAPTQTGTGAVGEVLTGDPGFWLTLADDATLTYRWTRRTTANAGETPVVIPGATGLTYTLTSADQGKTVRFEVVGSDQYGERTAAAATGTAVPAAGLSNGLHSIGYYSDWSPKSGASTTIKTLPINLGAADPAKKIVIIAETANDYAPTFAVLVGGVEYPLTKTNGTNPSGNSGILILLESDIPVGGDAVLQATYTSNTAPEISLVAHVFAGKNVARVAAPSFARITPMTAGTPVTAALTTQPGDIAVMALLAIPTSASGIISSASIVAELTDVVIPNSAPLQFWIGMGIDTVGGASRPISATPNVGGNAARINILYRSA